MFKDREDISSKADVLSYLKNKLHTAYVEDIYIVRASEFIENPDMVSKNIKDFYNGDKIVVRSSSLNEDCMETSNAGHFDSILDISSDDAEEIEDAVKKVLFSYIDNYVGNYSDKIVIEKYYLFDGNKKIKLYENFKNEQVLVQRQTNDVEYSGVVFTREIVKNRPYYMVNYDDNGSTDSVTSGSAGKGIYISKNTDIQSIDKPFDMLIKSVKEIENLCSIPNLDIEFAIRKNGQVVIFQTRPLAAVSDIDIQFDDETVFKAEEEAKKAYEERGHVLSDMAFWNPSEIIGDNPFPLDYSIYREIITSYIWSAGISDLGYHYINDELMYKIGNKPYISVDYSFEGLMPELIRPGLRRKLKNYYMKRLREDKTAHDKIEFEIVFSVYDFCTDENMDILLDYGFTKNEINEIQRALFFVTNMSVRKYQDIYEEDMHSLKRMQDLRHKIRAEKPMAETDIGIIRNYIGQLLYSIKSDGTPQFSRQARLAFMARSFCRTLVTKGYVEEENMDKFMQSINTVASDFERDFDAYSHGELSREEFNIKYGHLRLGTYNIRTDCYAKMYFDVGKSGLRGNSKKKPESYEPDKERISAALMDYEMDMDADEFIDFIRKTTENREYFKFEFTKSLSLILELIIRIGELFEIPRNDLSYLEIMDIFELEERKDFVHAISERKKVHDINSCLVLPEVIFEKKDIDVIYVNESRPNFITSKCVEGDIVKLDEIKDKQDINGKIVVITKADPGYDWIFTENIKGFITKYGGAASHMAIRCAEFDIPAAIGCGEKIYSDILRKNSICLDCQNRKIS